MSFRQRTVKQISCSDGFSLLTYTDKVSHTQTERATKARNLDYDQSRKEQEARFADTQGDTKLPELETTFKKRLKL